MTKEKISNLEKPRELSEKLGELQGAKIEKLKSPTLEKKGMELFRIDVTNQEKWDDRKDMKILIEVFGQAVLQAFGPRESKKKFILSAKELASKNDENLAMVRSNRKEARESLNHESDFGCSDTIYVVAEKGKMLSFFAASHKEYELEMGKKIKGLMINLVYTTPEKRNNHLCRGLFGTALNQEQVDAILSCSSTPGAVKEHMLVAKKMGYRNFFGGYLEGKVGDRGTLEDQKVVNQLSEQIQHGYFVDEATPPMEVMRTEYPHDLVINKENGPIPPLTKKDVDFARLGKPLEGVFKEAIEMQKGTDNTMYRLLISLPNKK